MSNEAIEPIYLTDDEARQLQRIVGHYRAAEARMQMAREMEIEFKAELRRKRGLGPEWDIYDIFDGFVRVPNQEGY